MINLETDRLFLRVIKKENAGFILKLLNCPNWIEYIGDRDVYTLKDAEAFIEERMLANEKRDGCSLLLVSTKPNDEPIGLCGLLKRPFLDEPDLGFAILPSYARQGYTFEASKSVLQYANTIKKIEHVYEFTSAHNIASQRLLNKLGMRLKEKKWIEDYEEECWIYIQE